MKKKKFDIVLVFLVGALITLTISLFCFAGYEVYKDNQKTPEEQAIVVAERQQYIY